MKRLWVALIIAVLAAGLCTAEMIYTLSKTNEAERGVSQAVQAYHDGDREEAAKESTSSATTGMSSKAF